MGKEISANPDNTPIQESWRLSDLDKLMEYMWLKPQVSKLNVDLFIDDGGAYERYGHSLLLYARNGYSKSINEFIPFSISENPDVLDDEIGFNVSHEDILSIMDFIRTNAGIINSIAKSEISHEEFVSRLSFVAPDRAMAEGRET